MTHYCRYPGCNQQRAVESSRDVHEQDAHYRCTCGRVFTMPGVKLHLARIERDNVPHPPIPNLPGLKAHGKLPHWSKVEDERPGPLDDLDYAELRDALGNLPQTWYPDLIRAMVEAAYVKRVFKPGGVVTFVQGVERRMDELEAALEEESTTAPPG